MERRGLQAFGWVSGVLGAVAVAAAAVLGVLVYLPDWSRSGQELWTFSWIGFPLAGAVIAGRRTRTRIGWLLIATGFAIALGRFGAIVGEERWRAAAEFDPITHLALSLYHFELVGFVLLAIALLHFPTDRLPSRRWRPFVAGVVLLAVAFIAAAPLDPTYVFTAGSDPVRNPHGIEVAGRAVDLVGPTLVIAAGIVLVDLIRRAVRSRGVVRKQLTWLAYAAAVFLAVFISVVASSVLFGGGTESSGWGDAAIIVAWVVCFNGFAIAIGVAVLRYRLYDIDRVASRTVTYAAVTGVLIAIYAVAVISFGRLGQALTGRDGSDLVIAASTLAVAAMFGPVNRRVRAAVDRRFNRGRYDAQRTVERFANELRDELDLLALSDRLRRTALGTVQPAHAMVWLREHR